MDATAESAPTQPSLTWTSERTLRISVADAISDSASTRILHLADRLRRAPLHGLRDVTPAYTAILMTFDPATLSRDAAERAVKAALADKSSVAAAPSRRVEIPVCYAGQFAPDLADVARHHGCTPDEIVRRHTHGAYRVSFIGFSPGFAYLAGLPSSLHAPRLARPRISVPAGSVAIGGEQTGIYPHATPGGWRIIGRTPLAMFDAARDEASALTPGDEVRFHSIDPGQFEHAVRERRA